MSIDLVKEAAEAEARREAARADAQVAMALGFAMMKLGSDQLIFKLSELEEFGKAWRVLSHMSLVEPNTCIVNLKKVE
jgi:hypothetical protein